jgi:hypothetical protein
MREPWDDFTKEELEILADAKSNVGWDDESFSEVCLCGHCEKCLRAISLAFETKLLNGEWERPDETEEVIVPSGCKIPRGAAAQVWELKRMRKLIGAL